MEKVYNTKLTEEQKADLKEYCKMAEERKGVVLFIRGTVIALVPDGYDNWYLGKAVASKHEKKLRPKVGMYYALSRAFERKEVVSYKVFNQIVQSAMSYREVTKRYYDRAFDESFKVVRSF